MVFMFPFLLLSVLVAFVCAREPPSWLLESLAGGGGAANKTSGPVRDLSSFVSSPSSPTGPKRVYAHFMLCFSAFGPKDNSTAGVAGYVEEISWGVERGALDGFALEVLGSDHYYIEGARGMFDACDAYNANLPPGREPFKLFFICDLGPTGCLSYHLEFQGRACMEHFEGRPAMSAWSPMFHTSAAVSTAEWADDFYAPIAAKGLPRPFFIPFIYACVGFNTSRSLALGAPPPQLGDCGISEECTLDSQMQTFADFPWIDGLWYWGCSPPPDHTIACFNATLAAARAAGKWAVGAVSAAYSPHGAGSNFVNSRYTHSAGGKGVVDVWNSHIANQMDLVIYTTWNDLAEHHYMGPFNKTICGFDNANGWSGCPNALSGPSPKNPAWTYGYNNWTHAGYLELAAAFIPWYKAPPGSPMPPITPATEGGFFFYNLQAINNSCPNDPVGPYAKYAYNDPLYPMEDVVYVHVLLESPASVTITSGAAKPVLFNLTAGVNYVKTPWAPGAQSFRVERAGALLADVTGTEAINTTEMSTDGCYSQTFSGVIRWAPPGPPDAATAPPSKAVDPATTSTYVTAATAGSSGECAPLLTPANVCSCCVCANVSGVTQRIDCSGGGRGVGITSSMLTSGSFSGFTGVMFLDLSSNHITTLPSGIFTGLPLNGALWLAGNQIAALPSDIFFNNTKMDFLGLQGNQLSALPDGIFKGCHNLYHLFLDHNQLCSYEGATNASAIEAAIKKETQQGLLVLAWDPQACAPSA